MAKTAPTKIIIDPMLVEKADLICPSYMPRTVFINQLVQEGIDSRIRLDGATEPASGQHSQGRSPSNSSKAVKENSHKERARSSSKTVERVAIPEELEQHREGINLFWQHKGGKKTPLAWNGLIRELGKIQQHMEGGNEAIATQLQKGAEAGWESITLDKYLKYGLASSGTPAYTKGSKVDWAAVEAMGSMF